MLSNEANPFQASRTNFDKDGKSQWKGVKAGQGFESNEDTDHKFCLVCSKLRYMPEGAAKTHNTQDCRQLAKFNRQLEERVEGENTLRIRRENYAGQRASSQRSYADHNKASVCRSEPIFECTTSVLRRSATVHISVSYSTTDGSASVGTSATHATCITCYGTVSTWY